MAIQLTQELKDFIARTDIVRILATASPDGVPNIGPKGSISLCDDQSLVYIEGIGKHHYENVKQNPKVAIACVHWESKEGYRFVGEAEVHSSGPLYERLTARLPATSKAAAVVQVRIDEVHALAPQKAGTRIL